MFLRNRITKLTVNDQGSRRLNHDSTGACFEKLLIFVPFYARLWSSERLAWQDGNGPHGKSLVGWSHRNDWRGLILDSSDFQIRLGY